MIAMVTLLVTSSILMPFVKNKDPNFYLLLKEHDSRHQHDRSDNISLLISFEYYGK